jgi:hypothetical protein
MNRPGTAVKRVLPGFYPSVELHHRQNRLLSDQHPLRDRNPSCAFAVNADDSAPLFPTRLLEQHVCQPDTNAKTGFKPAPLLDVAPSHLVEAISDEMVVVRIGA